jgi:heterodisulfide reductase subunit B
MAPTIFEDLISLTGATPIDWPRKLDCCGDPLHEANAALSEHMTHAKIADALASGAEVMCTACPHCHLRFDGVPADNADPSIRTLLYTQLLGLALGLPAKSLGL